MLLSYELAKFPNCSRDFSEVFFLELIALLVNISAFLCQVADGAIAIPRVTSDLSAVFKLG